MPAAAHHSPDILFSLFIVFVVAQVGAELAQRLRMPAVVGEIVAGIVVGPALLGWVVVSEPLDVLAEVGAVLLLFSVGLETRLADLKQVGRTASLVGVAGVTLPFVLGTLWAWWAGFEAPSALFVGAAFVATSAGITARVLGDLGALQRIESRVILGAAVIDDILAMLLLGAIMAFQAGGGVSVAGLLRVAVQAVVFVVLVAMVGSRVMRRSSALLEAPISLLSPLTICLAMCLGLAAVAQYLGLAAIVGAFLAGMVAAEVEQRHVLGRQVEVIMAFLVPFFFVVTGTKVELAALASWPTLGTLLLVTALAVAGKLLGCGLAARRLGRRSALIVGVGMVPRGEVGIIVASLGERAGVFGGRTYALIIAMSLLTAVVAPPLLKFLLAQSPEAADRCDDCAEPQPTEVEETAQD